MSDLTYIPANYKEYWYSVFDKRWAEVEEFPEKVSENLYIIHYKYNLISEGAD